MSGFGGFGGFGQNNNNNTQQSTGFGGGFGANNTTNTGFGSTTSTGFGASNTTGGGLFGSGTGGFGGSGGAFGSSGGAFGAAKPSGFGATNTTTTGSIFGAGTATANNANAGFGGFGSTPAATTGFGATPASTGGLFGSAASKPAFGGTPTAFGGGNTGSGFGATGGAFGAAASTALGGATADCQGTGSVPFQPLIEKEPNSTSNQQNSFQSISFQQPYQKWSPEELRLADYTAGRKFGNASNQPGAFGASTGFGGGSFGATNTTSTFGTNTANTGSNLFGSGGATSTPFGTSQPATTGFGNTTTAGGGLFGQNKPASNLFGQTNPAQPTTNLFGNSGTSGFGATSNTNTGFGATNTGSNLFGATNNAAAKPATFGFGGATSQPAATGFGAPTTGTGFGTGSNLFGANNQQQNTTNAFGAQQQQNSAPAFGTGFGTNTQPAATNSLFGAPKSAAPGLFGSTPAAAPTGGIFGNQSAANPNTFGAASNTQNTGLFGGVKPPTNSLFNGGGNAQNNATGSTMFGGLGGQAQNNNQQSSNLFGGLNTNNQQKPSLFTQSQPAGGGGFFGGSNNQQPGGNLFTGFGSTQQNQAQPQNSLFGNSQQGQQNSQSLTASIGDNAAYGGASLFSSLASSQINNPGPIATPLSSSVKQKKAAALPMYKLNSASASRFSTPQKRGFGFSYSNYGTPGSASSTASTPGTFSGSTIGSTFGRSLKTSVSTSSLRRSFGPEDSILAPGAFSASPHARHYGSAGSVKKLNINRNLRTDLFTPPTPQQPPATPGQNGILRKRVSFDSNTTKPPAVPSPLKTVTNGSSPSSEELGYIRPSSSTNLFKSATATATEAPEMGQVKNNELAVVHEEEAPQSSRPQRLPIGQEDQTPGRYWSIPSLEEIKNMSREEQSRFEGFRVGRDGIGEVKFTQPVDFTKLKMDDIMGNIVQFQVRSCTVYSDVSRKPPMGEGLNLPATISLQNSWPRKKEGTTPSGEKSGVRFNKHIERLKRVTDTTFLSYDKDSGVWTFAVQHFTTYGFPDDDETDGEVVSEFGQSTLSAPPDTPTPKSCNLGQSFASTSEVTHTESDPEDTFEFRKKKVFPGSFDMEVIHDEDNQRDENQGEQYGVSFLDERSVGSLSENGVDEPMDQDDVYQDDESVSIVDQEMAGSYPQAGNTAELEDEGSQDDYDATEENVGAQNALVRARMRAVQKAETPKKKFAAGNDWAATLRKTVSPKKQDRNLLKSQVRFEDDARPEFQPTPTVRSMVPDGHGFATSIDLMNSLFGQAKSPVKSAKFSATGKGFKWPYAKRPKTIDSDMKDMSSSDRAFHESMKPSWGPHGTLVYSVVANANPFGRSSRRSREKNGLLVIQKGAIVSEGRDVRFAHFSSEASADMLRKQKNMTSIEILGGVPFASLPKRFLLSDFCDDRPARDTVATHENLVWTLGSILWDELMVPDPLKDVEMIEERLRKDNLSIFWQKMVDASSSQHVALAKSCEERAIAALTGHRIPDACGHLLKGKNFHLATLVALIGGKDSVRKDIRAQLQEWQKSKVLSEFSQPIRALYELLAGNVCICDGSKGVSGEDRLESFSISKRFGLNWRQAFGLRLWYGCHADEPIEAAVVKFAEDLANDRETTKPQAWYVEEKIPALWEDPGREVHEDLLFGLLKLHTFHDTSLEEILTPSNSRLSPLDFRLSWQLSQVLTSASIIEYKSDYKADELTLSFASQLVNESSWLEAIFVLLHLSSADAREKSIQTHLAQFAGKIGSEDGHTFSILTKDLKIPAPWIWKAKALYMRSVERDPRREVECLIRAGSFNEAHSTFAREVAPKNIVELDYEVLDTLLTGFRGKEDAIPEWHLGGQIYLDFLELVETQKTHSHPNPKVLERLLAGLPAVVVESRYPSFMETVAVETISGAVAKHVVALRKRGEKVDLPKVLRLPLTEDKYLKHAVDLSLEYYRSAFVS
ncbi:putative nucleoporin [Amylocarpus encephaloides]|uniref:Nucleoporin n=1 Tax=Amylocarpus encephaloides TaxID=45428 RepID=A0A9P7YCU4_9HELO|nr:putative nucleoporin [Amylocarpus encephaloides]